MNIPLLKARASGLGEIGGTEVRTDVVIASGHSPDPHRAELDLQPTSVVSFETHGAAGSWSPWLLAHPAVQLILAVAARNQAAISMRWASDTDEEIEIPGD